MRKHRKTLIVAGAVVLLALLSLLPRLARREAGNTVRVYVDGALYAELPLFEDTTLRIAQENGSVNEVCIENGGVHMAFANCPHQECVKQGELTPENREIRALGGWILCLPNRVSVELAPDE